MEKIIGKSKGKAIISILTSVTLIFSLFLPANSYGAVAFKDIKGHWAEQYIEKAVNQGIIKGYADGNFLPDEKVSRSEFISMINRALKNTSTGGIGFNDVQRDAWYYTDVSKAVTAGFVSGFDDGSFRPNHKITRQEAAVILARIVPTYGYSANLRNFKDYGDIGSWAYTAIGKICGKGYISGYTDGRIHPLDSLTRAQAAKIISDIVIKESIETSDPLVKKNGTKLSGRIYSNNVTIHKDLDDGDASVDNCVILGKLVVQGGGEDSITVNNSRIAEAVVNRGSNAVRVLAKGETSIANLQASGEFILQTSGISGDTFGTGFEKVSFSASSKGTLQGNFPKVSLDGSSTELKLTSGTIKSLDVNSSGRRSNIYVDSKATVTQANVYGESYFWGSGTVSDMQVYAKGITYETKPKKWTIHSGAATPSQSDPELTMTFDPKEGKTNVYLDTKISIAFNSSMREKGGSAITNSKITDIVTIRKGSTTGSTVAYSGSINSAKTVMTLTPSSSLEAKTKYYIVVKSGTMINENDEKNEAFTSYFTTGSDTEKFAITYSPANGETNVPVNKKSFTISFSEAVTKNNGGTISANDSYLKEAVLLQGGNIKAANYSVSINSKKTQITISLEDNYSLALNTKYTVSVLSSKFRTSEGTAIASSNASWTTTGAPSLSGASVTPYEKNIELKVTPNVSGTVYAVLLPENSPAPTAAQIKDGKDKDGKPAVIAKSATASSTKIVSLDISGEAIERDTAYRIYAVLYDGAANASSIINLTTRTEPLKLKSLSATLTSGGENYVINFKPYTYNYEILIPNGTDSIKINAEANADMFPGKIRINGGDKPAIISLDGSSDKTVEIVVQEDGKRSQKYEIKIKVRGSAGLESMSINGKSYTPNIRDKFALPADEGIIKLIIYPVESEATIKIGADTIGKGELKEYTIGDTTDRMTFTIISADKVTTAVYEILFDRTSVSNFEL